MSLFAIIIYETIYAVIYLGLLFSKSTLLLYFPNPSLAVRALFLLILFSGFFVPYYLSLLRIKLTKGHYLVTLTVLLGLYAVGSWYYYALLFNEKRFTGYHSFLQMKPPEHALAIPKPPHVFRILCLGGSTTKGELSTEPYPALLEKMLSARYPGSTIEVVNGGHFFYTTQHSIIEYLFDLKELEPDVIIFFEAINDLMASFTSPPYSSSPYRKDYGHFLGWIGGLRYQKSFEQFLAQFFYMDLRRPIPKPISFTDFKSRHSFARNVETIIEIAKWSGITLVLSNQAHCFSNENTNDVDFLGFQKYFLIDNKNYADEKSWYAAMELFNKTIQDTANKYSIPFVNQEEAFRGKRSLFTDSVHMTTEGNRIKAQLFFDTIVGLGLIKEGRQP
jgi:lysophospholipase L1-like esterase